MSVTREEILHLAKLSALQLTEEEIVAMQNDLDNILQYVSILNEIDTTGIEPLSHPIAGVESAQYQ